MVIWIFHQYSQADYIGMVVETDTIYWLGGEKTFSDNEIPLQLQWNKTISSANNFKVFTSKIKYILKIGDQYWKIRTVIIEFLNTL